MKWTHKLSEEEFQLLKETLEKLFNLINAKVILENTPTKLQEGISSIGQNETFESYNYNIKIISNVGEYETMQGFFDDLDIESQIKNIVKTIGVEYCIIYNIDKMSTIGQEIDKIN
jgi:hypothetical protein